MRPWPHPLSPRRRFLAADRRRTVIAVLSAPCTIPRQRAVLNGSRMIRIGDFRCRPGRSAFAGTSLPAAGGPQ